MSAPIVETKQGKLQGKVSTNLDGGNFFSYHGIPYAKPPVGNLRFKDPQPAANWSGIKDATIEANECIARHMVYENIIGSEDCLYLNVYTAEITKPKPVMVWIHGGAFRTGSSKTDIYGPEFLLTEDIVLVTLNYRLGIFGFLQLNDTKLEVLGNAGLKDQVLALKWVQQNIKTFGGDPSNVTIFGESAGAASVHYLVLSPLTKGLFHKAIMQSGSALNDFALGCSEINDFIKKALDLENINEDQLLNTLTRLSSEELFKVYEKTNNLCAENILGGRLRFAPVIEKPTPKSFISEEPIKIIKSGNYNKVPMIFGYTITEGMLIEFKIRPRKPAAPKDFEAIIPYKLQLKRGSDKSKEVANKIKQFYYGDLGSENNLENFYKLHTDNYFVRDIQFSVCYHSLNNEHPVYLYRMSVESNLNLFKKLFKTNSKGVAHGDDIGYLFKTRLTPTVESGSLEELSIKRFVKYWTNFARFGNPNPGVNSNDPEWKPVLKDAMNFIDIGEQIIAGVNPDSERMEFWKEICRCNPLYTM